MVVQYSLFPLLMKIFFFGSNKNHREEYLNKIAIWFKSGDTNMFGAAYTGWYFPDYQWEDCEWYESMGGINSAGLCFDMNGVLSVEDIAAKWLVKTQIIITITPRF